MSPGWARFPLPFSEPQFSHLQNRDNSYFTGDIERGTKYEKSKARHNNHLHHWEALSKLIQSSQESSEVGRSHRDHLPFTDKETGTERLSALPKVTQLARGTQS